MIGLKPVHHDEAVNGQFIQNLWTTGFYNYDPNNYHGPLLIYLMGLSEKLFGWGIESIRLVPILFSVIWLWFLFRWTSTRYRSSRWMTILFATSCAFLFFARSGIHEMVFVFFMTLALAGVAELLDFRNPKGWLWILWGFWGAICLKETWALTVIGAAVALPIILWQNRWAFKIPLPKNWQVHLFTALFTWLFLFTSGLSDYSALKEFFMAFMPWTKTGVHGAGHEKPFFYWLNTLYKHEFPILILWIFSFSGLLYYRKRLSPAAQFLGILSTVQFLAYSLIPYKTPWCILAILGPILIFCMVAWRQILDSFVLRSFVKVIIVIAALVGWQATENLNFKAPTTPHDYVYVQTDTRLKVLMDYLHSKAKSDPGLYNLKVQVAGTEAWPMAWWLMPFAETRYMGMPQGLLNPIDFLIIDESEMESVEKTGFGPGFHKMIFPIREGRLNSVYYLSQKLFPDFPMDQIQ